MQVFKTALKTVFRHPVYMLIYAVALGFMGVAMASSFSFGTGTDPFTEYEGRYALVDRDNSTLSESLDDLLSAKSTRVEVADDELALQDAVAKGSVSLIVIVPEGFEAALFDAAQGEGDLPALQTVSGYYSAESSLLEQSLSEYVGILGTYAASSSDAASVASRALDAVSSSSEVESITVTQEQGEAQRFAFFLQWSTYTLFTSIIVCVGLMMSKLERTDVRRRSLTAPVGSLSLSMQTAAAGFVVMLAEWAWTMLLGMVSFPEAVASISPLSLALMALATLLFATVPLSVGFLLGKLGANELISNAVGNITGMVCSFLGGAWVSLDLLGSEMRALAHFTPAFWFNSAVNETLAIDAAGGIDSSLLGSFAIDLGVLVLFALCIFSVALVAARLRVQSATAGGNAAAAAPAN